MENYEKFLSEECNCWEREKDGKKIVVAETKYGNTLIPISAVARYSGGYIAYIAKPEDRLLAFAAILADKTEPLDILYHKNGFDFIFDSEKVEERENKMNELQIFKNKQFGEIRTLEENGKILFCGNDAAKMLGYGKPRNAIAAHCKGALKQGVLTNGGIQEMTFITEGDLYRLITHSKLPSAERFERWVFDEVLPAIRKHGVYAVDELLSNPDLAIRAFTALKEERAKNGLLAAEIARKDQLIGELKPLADYMDRILQNPGLVTITQIAKDYGMSGRAMNNLLSDLGVQYKQSGQWLLYRKYHNKGYTHSKTIEITRSDGSPDVVMETKWTQKGRLFLYELLKENDVLPVIEQAA
ncbi:phage antirepressor [Christensenella massiliensis]